MIALELAERTDALRREAGVIFTDHFRPRPHAQSKISIFRNTFDTRRLQIRLPEFCNLA